ncbi:MAG: polysaccharide biosynthesis tyrosine autokinase [Deltaproteobacteria bacterium]|nr:polysaccharide biosynthesis tyrosine autokinase [Deltaproteobacteria bacterium]
MSQHDVISIPPPPAQQPAHAPQDAGPDIWEYILILRRRMLLIVLTVLVAVGLTAFVTMRMTKIYRATVTLRIETQAPRVLGKDVENVVEMGTGSYWSNQEYYETQYKIIASRDVSARVVKDLKLNEDPEFMGVPEEERAGWKPVTIDKAASIMQDLLTVEPVKDSRLARIHVDHPDPARAQLYANAVAKAYLDKNLEAMLQGTVDAVDWLSKQLDDAKTKLSASESSLYGYKKDNDILSVSLEERQNMLTAQLEATAGKLGEARANRIAIQARKNAVAKVSSTGDPMAIPLDSLNNSPIIQNLKEEQVKLSQEYGELYERYGDNFPRIIEIKAKMKRIREDLTREVNNVLAAVDAELDAARATEAGLDQSLKDLTEQALEVNQKEMEYNRLAREKTNNEKVYEMLLGRTKEADLSKLLRVNNIEILDPALLPVSAIRPRMGLNLALAMVLGLILGVGLAITIEFADRTMKTQEDLEALGIAFLGIVPSISDVAAKSGSYAYAYGGTKPRKRKGKHAPVLEGKDGEAPNYDLFVHDYPKSQVAESCRAIRTNLLFMSPDKPARRILVTSPSPQEGKTTVAINVAIAIAQSGARTLLVDTDMRRPRIHRAFGLKPKVGISTMVLGESTFEESVVTTQVPNLHLLPCGPTPPNPAELMHTEAFERVIADLSARFDKLVFDSPPVAVVTDAAILSKLVDGTMLILKSLKTSRDMARHATNVLRDIGANILGGVLNDLDLENRKYGYYYYYRQKYGYYESEDKARDSANEAEQRPAAS